MCVSAEYEGFAFYIFTAAVALIYFSLVARILKSAKGKAVDPTPYEASVLLVGVGLPTLGGLKLRSTGNTEIDRRLLSATKAKLAWLSLMTSLLGLVAMLAIFNCPDSSDAVRCSKAGCFRD